MTKQKKEFIQKYIDELKFNISDYSNLDISELFDSIHKVLGIFSKDYPYLEDYLRFDNNSAYIDTEILIGLLEKELIEDESSNEESEDEKSTYLELLNKIRIETGSIKSILSAYTSDSIVINYIAQLENALNVIDIESIKYCLSCIKAWYNSNINNIMHNNFVHNVSEHQSSMNKINLFAQEVEKIPDTFMKKSEEIINTSNTEPLIFLSHCSKDKKYGDALEYFITGLGVKSSQLIYTSHPLHKIPLDANIYDYLRKNINKNVFMIILWSNDYLESPACLNEMGAAWVAQSDYTNIYVPDFEFGNKKYHECAVDTKKMGAVLKNDQHCKTAMIELKNKIQELFSLENDEVKVNYILDEFMKKIREEA